MPLRIQLNNKNMIPNAGHVGYIKFTSYILFYLYVT